MSAAIDKDTVHKPQETGQMNRLLFTATLLSFTLGLSAQTLPYAKKHYNLTRGVAIAGYDPVSYFDQKPQKGSTAISYNHSGVIYYFVSEANKAAFVKNPALYEPQYGGYCAYAIADGDKVKVDPLTYKIIDRKLYLFYNFRGTNTLELWNKNEKSLLSNAQKRWSEIIRK
ncbi:YHS domain-containing (seleno)protein [Roseivirga sp. UBA1976]|uniref:YHS domain-containing (seleno)protein n=1 Tax=Roseivirga sp. UBA1976 TaxID=1947386 RepID=UPI00257D10E2|nr:YHS domain-containing (seleno)protein [Roseivirga sp. UBA1976]MEC7755072.1 YHS domain-containing (seleno)protein [Bacteroidota bacterium]